MQAYTVELEAEVSQLKEENMRLRKQQVSTRKSVRTAFLPSSNLLGGFWGLRGWEEGGELVMRRTCDAFGVGREGVDGRKGKSRI